MCVEVEALRNLCRNFGVIDEEKFRETAEVFGYNDVHEFSEVLTIAIDLIYDNTSRTIFRNALNLDRIGSRLEIRRRRLEDSGEVPLKVRMIIRREVDAASQVVHHIKVLTESGLISRTPPTRQDSLTENGRPRRIYRRGRFAF